jgi:hypothetical protein
MGRAEPLLSEMAMDPSGDFKRQFMATDERALTDNTQRREIV